jgi:glutamyl-tRNA synthetase
VPYLQQAGLLAEVVGEAERSMLLAAAPLVSERMTVLSEAVDMLGFLFVQDARFTVDPADAAKVLTEEGLSVVKASRAALESLPEWTTEAIEAALRDALVEQMGLKPRHAFGPVRVAVTGRRVSPPLFESMELLGRERSLRRLDAAGSA